MSEEKIKITLDDLAKVRPAEQDAAAAPARATAAEPGPGAGKKYGNIAEEPQPAAESKATNIVLQGWFYLGVAGLTGALLAWAICEPGFDDGPSSRWGNYWIFPMMLMLLCVGFGTAESVVERSPRKALVRGGLSLLLGAVLGFVFYAAANLIFNVGVMMLAASGVTTPRNPAFWIIRAIAWMVFGAAGGVVYGIVGRSGKKAAYGVLGGMLGAGVGGLVFDPVSFALGGAEASRAIGMSLFGISTGVAMGLVESALKDRWLFVAAGPLAGKQFILYKPLTMIGANQQCDIYLFKDPSVQQQHAAIEMRGAVSQLRAAAPVYVSGQPVQSHVLRSGDLVQIGRYAFRYQEKQRDRR